MTRLRWIGRECLTLLRCLLVSIFLNLGWRLGQFVWNSPDRELIVAILVALAAPLFYHAVMPTLRRLA